MNVYVYSNKFRMESATQEKPMWESQIPKTEWRQENKKQRKQRSISIRQLINYDILRTCSTWLPQKVNASSVSLCLLHPFLVHIKNEIAYIWIEYILLKIYAYDVYREHTIHTHTHALAVDAMRVFVFEWKSLMLMWSDLLNYYFITRT